MTMPRYRLEWRPPPTVAEAPSLALSSEHDGRRELVAAAREVMGAGRTQEAAFRLSKLRPDGSAAATVMTDFGSLEVWSDCPCDMPRAAATAWTADDERAAAGIDAALAIRRSLNRAVRARTLDLRQALRLVADSSRLLDPDVD